MGPFVDSGDVNKASLGWTETTKHGNKGLDDCLLKMWEAKVFRSNTK